VARTTVRRQKKKQRVAYDYTTQQKWLSNEMLAENVQKGKQNSQGTSSSLFLLAKLATAGSTTLEGKMLATAGSTPLEGKMGVSFESNFESNVEDTSSIKSLEDTRRSLPPTCVFRNPSDFHKSSPIDSHGVRFKESDGNGEKWKWKCRYCQQVLLVGHGAPNVHLKNLHRQVLGRGGLKKLGPDNSPVLGTRSVQFAPPAKKRGVDTGRSVLGASSIQFAPSAKKRRVDEGNTKALFPANNRDHLPKENGHKNEQMKPVKELWKLLESTKPSDKKRTGASSKLWKLLESTKPSSLPKTH